MAKALLVTISLFVVVLTRAQVPGVLPEAETDSGVVAFCVYDFFDEDKDTIYCHTRFYCQKQDKKKVMTVQYQYRETVHIRPQDTLRVNMLPEIFRYDKKAMTLTWNDEKLEFAGAFKDSLNHIEGGKYIYDEPGHSGEETMFYFSPRFGLICQYNIAMGNTTSYTYLSGDLKGKSFELHLK